MLQHDAPGQASFANYKRRQVVEPRPGDRVVPLHFFENSLLVQGNNMAVSLVFDNVLDPEKLRLSLEAPFLTENRRMYQASGKIEWHIPVEFTAERPAITFTHVDHGVSAASRPAASRIPKPSSRPAVVGDPDDLADLAWESGYQPGGIKDYLASDKLVLGLRVNSFTDKTIVVLQWEDEIPTPCNPDSDPFDVLAQGTRPATEPHVLTDRRVGLEKALEELRSSAIQNGEDASKVFLTGNDILTAWTIRSVVTSMGMTPSRTVAASIAMSLRKAFEGDLIPNSATNPYVGNAFGWANILVRRAINQQGTRAQHEAYYSMVRTSGTGLPIIIFGDGGMAQIGSSNWSKAGLFNLDFAPARKVPRAAMFLAGLDMFKKTTGLSSPRMGFSSLARTVKATTGPRLTK
ncbi:hypothetical protein SAPIO_CDS9276 [Scedosporium apiospermum]|uniref:Uncharacterized protein n=1 Tax=Pseudallescheria apiosperma TaxID=563466 RepID=A0A084FYQ6_PSEDA|nr:uncharacterized protein SAPIO_CDS9276 [Scedosporium apiospermum]KEZ40218.1 hypothetical protein SAPIO_CDS9276 [Scedosporium apiospermum]